MTDLPFKQIDVSDMADDIGEAVEIARIFAANGGGNSFLINPAPLADPYDFGRMIVEMMKHGAMAYAHQSELEPQQAFDKISKGFFAQLEHVTKQPEGGS